MSRHSTLILLGIFAIVTPFSGLPATLRTLLTVIVGAAVLGIGMAERARMQRSATAPALTPVLSSAEESAVLEPSHVISSI